MLGDWRKFRDILQKILIYPMAFLKTRWFRILAIALVSLVLVLGISLLVQPRQSQKSPIPIALAVPLSTPGGEEIKNSIQLYFNSVNQGGGINGHPLQLLAYDDQANTERAKQVAQEIVQSPALVVLGHRGSDASIAAGEFYAKANLSAITGTANSDRLTQSIPTYFRSVYNNSTYNRVSSLYAQQVMGYETARIIYDQASANERSQAEALKDIFKGEILPLDVSSADKQSASLRSIVNQLSKDKSRYLLILTNSKEEVAQQVLLQLRRGKITAPIFADQALGRESFARLFAQYPEEKENPGFFTDGMFVLSPIIFDSAGADAQDFLNRYQSLYQSPPSYLGAKFYEAALLAVQALKKTELVLNPESVSIDRQAILKALQGSIGKKHSIPGLSGNIYFNSDRSSDLPARVGQFRDYRLLSAPQQFTPIFDPDSLDITAELKAGSIVQSQDRYFWKQRVVYTGIDINRLNRIQQNSSSYTIDFYLWFRYSGDDLPVMVQFPDAVVNSVNPTAPIYDPQAPARKQVIGGLNYRLYQIRGDFRNAFNFQDYPFDRQRLVLRFDNPFLTSERLVYVIDKVGLKLPRSNEEQRRPFQGLQLWNFRELSYSQDTARSSSTLGSPKLSEANNPIDYPGFSVRMTLQRRTLVFLSKNLLPIILLTFFTYCTLYFPYSMFVPRIMAPASALLSGIVLLLSFNNQLPEVGYTVAIEYVFYTYFLLCLLPIIVTTIGFNWDKAGNKIALQRLDMAGRILFPCMVLSVALTYAIIYGERLQG